MSGTVHFYEFEHFRIDLDQRNLLRGGEIVSLTPKAFDTLLAFVRHSQYVLEKDALLQMIWPDTFVEEANLAVNVSLLRKALGERADGGPFIETVPRRGYRFAVAVREIGEGLHATAAAASTPQGPA